MQICPVGARLFHINGQLDRQDKAISQFLQLSKCTYNYTNARLQWHFTWLFKYHNSKMKTNTYTVRPQFPAALCSLSQEKAGRTHHPTVRVEESKQKTEVAFPLNHQNLSTKPCSSSTPENLSMFTNLCALM
jgi:hypothetical protein